MFGELNGVAHQVSNNLLQAQRVANDVIRHIVFDIQRQLQPLIVRRVRQQRDHLVQRSAQQERNTLQNKLPGFELREVQNIVNDGQQIIRGTLNGSQVIALGGV